MHTQVIAIYISSYRHGLERVDKLFVDFFFLELVENFSSECEMFSHSSALMVSTKHRYFFGEVQLDNELNKFRDDLTFFHEYLVIR